VGVVGKDPLRRYGAAGQATLSDSLIILRDRLRAEGAESDEILLLEATPQRRVEADISQVAVVLQIAEREGFVPGEREGR